MHIHKKTSRLMQTVHVQISLHKGAGSSGYTMLCLSFGTPKNNKFSICSKWKIDYMSQNLGTLQSNSNVLNIGTPKHINFLFGTNGKLMVLGVPILKHFRVSSSALQ